MERQRATINNKRVDSPAESVVVSFRAPRNLVDQLDTIAQGDQRTRANFIVRTLTHAVTLEPAIQVIEQVMPALYREHCKNPDSPRCEGLRGELRGARAVAAAFFGKRAVRWIEERVRERTKVPIPHVVPLSEDGNRYGFDSGADIV